MTGRHYYSILFFDLNLEINKSFFSFILILILHLFYYKRDKPDNRVTKRSYENDYNVM